MTCAAPVALVSLVAGERQWFKAQAGFEPRETSLDKSVCAHVLGAPGLLVIPDLTLDPRTSRNPPRDRGTVPALLRRCAIAGRRRRAAGKPVRDRHGAQARGADRQAIGGAAGACRAGHDPDGPAPLGDRARAHPLRAGCADRATERPDFRPGRGYPCGRKPGRHPRCPRCRRHGGHSSGRGRCHRAAGGRRARLSLGTRFPGRTCRAAAAPRR